MNIQRFINRLIDNKSQCQIEIFQNWNVRNSNLAQELRNSERKNLSMHLQKQSSQGIRSKHLQWHISSLPTIGLIPQVVRRKFQKFLHSKSYFKRIGTY